MPAQRETYLVQIDADTPRRSASAGTMELGLE
jgi:hypothetical protein